MQNLLIVSNQPSPNTKKLVDAVVRGANHEDVDSIAVRFVNPLEASATDVLDAQGIIIGTTENFGYMSGQVKDFFERIYYPCLEKTQGLPYALFVKGGLDGTGARSCEPGSPLTRKNTGGRSIPSSASLMIFCTATPHSAVL